MVNKQKLSKEPSQFSCVYDKQGFIGVLNIAGAVTPEYLREFNKRLLDALEDTDFVVVNLDKTSCVDTELFSFFCVAARRAYANNKRLKLGRMTPEQRSVVSKMCISNVSVSDRCECKTQCFMPEGSLVHNAKGMQ